MQLRLLRLFLAFSALAWGVSIVGVFLSWSAAVEILEGFGAKQISYDSMLDYWFRMTAGAFVLIGCLFGAAALCPKRYAAMIPLLGYLLLFEGTILFIHGMRLKLPPFPFYADVTACVLGGTGILKFRHAANPNNFHVS